MPLDSYGALNQGLHHVPFTETQWNTLLSMLEDSGTNPQAEPQNAELWAYIQEELNKLL